MGETLFSFYNCRSTIMLGTCDGHVMLKNYKTGSRVKNKVGNWQTFFLVKIVLMYNKVGNSIDESDMQESYAPLELRNSVQKGRRFLVGRTACFRQKDAILQPGGTELHVFFDRVCT